MQPVPSCSTTTTSSPPTTPCWAWRCTSNCPRSPRCSAGAPPPSAPSPTPRSARCASVCRVRCRCSTTRRSTSAIRIGLAVNCEIATWCRFARKNYFYPDMPKNYQISQYDEPIAINGYLDVPLDDGSTWRVEVERAHMEEDTGKSLHIGSDTGRIEGATESLLDYNRAGVPLIEIVTKPIDGTGDRAPQIARAYVTALRELLRALGVSDVRMDQGSMRCDANVSLKPKGAEGVRHPDRDQERQLAQERRGGGALRDAPPGRGAGGRRHDHPGDPALSRGRLHQPGPHQGDRGGLPVFPRTRPGTGGTQPRIRRTSCAGPSRSSRGWRASEFSRNGECPTR